ncbi:MULTISPECIES: sigma-70 family RNA polymerase sigma factor [unclassified Devosia]|jgi:RNA polymerase sigma-70 factor (ECF subfamily)|uniref:sigma-70 family RNA polymerase sigma factor n=1 Tax=unclassified Devosia TaxID=196773 RepID=UPI001553063C|nr:MULTISPECIES: sigma-70 family RNA polymerase sigma factor [unclassified Devosia]MDF2797570.1 sigma-70 family polymerase sigma factor [Devosia sp.]
MQTPSPEIAELISRCALRDRAAFRSLYERTSAKLFGVVLRILKDRSEAEEAIQEVYVKIWQRADRYVPGHTSPISWLVAVARNHSLDILRARRPVADDIDTALDIADDAPNPEQATADRQVRGQIDSCLQTLEPDRAEAVRGAYLDGFSYEELAQRHSIPLNTMRTWLRRSLLRLRECLSA